MKGNGMDPPDKRTQEARGKSRTINGNIWQEPSQVLLAVIDRNEGIIRNRAIGANPQ